MDATIRRLGISQDGRQIATLVTTGETSTVTLLVESLSPEDLDALSDGFRQAAVTARRQRSSNAPLKERLLTFLPVDPREGIKLGEIQRILEVSRPTADRAVSDLIREGRVKKQIKRDCAGQPFVYWRGEPTNAAT